MPSNHNDPVVPSSHYCGCLHEKRSSVFTTAFRAVVIVAFALIGVVAFTPTASAFDNITTATSTENSGFGDLSDASFNYGFKYIAPSQEHFQQINAVFGRGTTAATTTFRIDVYQATSTSFGNYYATPAGLGTLIATSASTTPNVAQGGSATTTFTFPTAITLDAGTGYVFVYTAGYKNATASNKWYQRLPTGTGRFQNGVWQSAFIYSAGGYLSNSAPAAQSIEIPFTGDTAILTISPQGETVASTTVEFEIEYFFNDSNFNNFESAEICVQVQSLEQFNYTSETLASFESCEDILVSGDGTFSTTTVLGGGLFQGYATINVNGEIYDNRPFRFIVISSQLPEAWPIIAGVATSTGQGGYGTVCENELPDNAWGWVAGAACFIIDGIRSVFQFLWMPSPEIVAQYGALSLRNRAPFEYVYQVGEIWEMMYTTAATGELNIVASTTIGSLTLLSTAQIEAWEPIPTLFKTTLSFLLWFMMAMYIYRRVLRIHDKT